MTIEYSNIIHVWKNVKKGYKGLCVWGGNHHINGITEIIIRSLSDISRAMMVHAK